MEVNGEMIIKDLVDRAKCHGLLPTDSNLIYILRNMDYGEIKRLFDDERGQA